MFVCFFADYYFNDSFFVCMRVCLHSLIPNTLRQYGFGLVHHVSLEGSLKEELWCHTRILIILSYG